MFERREIAVGLQHICLDGELLGIILRNDFESESIRFFTDDSFSQQLGYLPHRQGGIIRPHVHKLNTREVHYTHEVLLLKKGTVRINFYSNAKAHVGSETLRAGDVILLCGGGHGFEIEEDTVMIEIKQGPYMGVDDKERFEGVERDTRQ